jgi:hypothetical protein
MRHQRRPGNNGGEAVDNEYRLYVGIDWASEAHQACVPDQTRRIVSERAFAHAGDAVAAFAEWLNDLAGDDPGGVAVAIEIPRGAVVETLVERGFHIYAINPNSSIASATATALPAPRMTGVMPSSSVIRCAPIETVFGACTWTIQW